MTLTTHCLPNGYLETDQLPVPNVPGCGTYLEPSGTKRGVAVLLHGLNTSVITSFPITPQDSGVGGLLPVYYGTLATNLKNDGWVVLFPSYAEDNYSSGVPAEGLYNDVNSDSGHGSRYLNTTLLWWDHVLNWCQTNYPGLPIMPIGMSEGGWHVLVLSSLRSSTIVGAISHCPATIWENVSYQFTQPVNFASTNLSGLDIGVDALNNCNIPVMISYGTNDAAVGWENPGGSLPTSNTNSIIINAQAAGRPITRNQTNDNHELLLADSGAYYDGSTSSLSSLSTLTLNSLAPGGFISGECSILASDGQWHVITFSGSSGNTLTGCSYSGDTSATVSQGSLICTTGSATDHPMSFMYYIKTVIDPLT